jgi:uncharacterized OB-fold protein
VTPRGTSAEERQRPVPPAIDRDSARFWSALRDEALALQHCEDCLAFRFPPLPACPRCGSSRFGRTVVSGRGRIYSFITVHRAFGRAFANEVPYTLGAVDLEEGPRVVGRIVVDANLSVRFGMDVVAQFHHHEDWTELRFGPA